MRKRHRDVQKSKNTNRKKKARNFLTDIGKQSIAERLKDQEKRRVFEHLFLWTKLGRHAGHEDSNCDARVDNR
jgi:hypothetical protein